jgi:hypothetical protein
VTVVIGKSNRRRALDDGCGHIERIPRPRRGQIAVEVVGVRGVADAVDGAGDRGDRVRQRRAGCRIGVGADVRLRGDVKSETNWDEMGRKAARQPRAQCK